MWHVRSSTAFPIINVLRVLPSISHETIHLPVLGDVESPLKLEMPLLIVVDEGAYGCVVTTRKHSGRGIFFSNYICQNTKQAQIYKVLTSFGVDGRLVGVWSKGALFSGLGSSQA